MSENNNLEKSSESAVRAYWHGMNWLEHYNKIPKINWLEIFNVAHIFQKWANELSTKPTCIWQAQYNFLTDYIALCQKMITVTDSNHLKPMIEPETADRRFKSEDWRKNPQYFFYQQCYLLFVHHCLEFVKNNPSKDSKIEKQISFFTKQYLNALSPTNFVLTNPEVLKRTLASKGENLAEGFSNFLADINRGHGRWSFKMTDMAAFEVGKNIAITPGKVIYQNHLMQLIQYSPSTKQAYERPLLIIPPWINKYYILDLRGKNSFVKWILDQGFTLFMISWVNPDESYRNTSFEDYIFQGVLSAIDVITEETNADSINALGFCIGGTLLATCLGYMQAKNDYRINCASFLATLIDFKDPGEIEVFIDDEQITSLEEEMEEEGYLDGRILGNTFNLLRANDLFWPYFVNNYLFGKNPYSFDLLYWNCDSTNLPKKMVSDFVRQMYMENLLIQSGKLVIKDVKIDLSKVTMPVYFVSTEQDHIAPWRSTFDGTRCFKGPVTFVLGESGHIAGIVNPTSCQKYGYHYHDDISAFTTANEWLDHAAFSKGSWWAHWGKWLTDQSGKLKPSREPGKGKYSSIQDAPGDYVKRKI